MKVCVDASLVLKWLLPEEGSDVALQLLKKWRKEGFLLVGPTLLDYEVGSTLRQKIVRGLIGSEDLFPFLDYYRRLDLLLFHLPNLLPESLSAAASLGQTTIYDVSYLLLARQQKTDFITADKKFWEAAHPLFPCVRFYQDLV